VDLSSCQRGHALDELPISRTLPQIGSMLRQMLEWHMECEHDWAVAPGSLGKGLKKWLRSELWVELESTYTGADMQDNWDALLRTVALFRKSAKEVGAQLGYTYPEALDRRVMDYVKQVSGLAPQG
jgi:aminoglycoside 6-adenylyltransferase